MVNEVSPEVGYICKDCGRVVYYGRHECQTVSGTNSGPILKEDVSYRFVLYALGPHVERFMGEALTAHFGLKIKESDGILLMMELGDLIEAAKKVIADVASSERDSIMKEETHGGS